MATPRSKIVYGYHGCPKSVADKILGDGNVMLQSHNEYDWLGDGIYFWEDAPNRAYEWAKKLHPKDEPAVIGAKIDLGHCLNLMDVKACDILSQVYTVLKDNAPQLPENKGKLHYLDRLVINTANDFAVRQGVPYDTVRCAFPEGNPVFPGSSILDRSHIQIAVRQERAIKELFVVDIQTLTK